MFPKPVDDIGRVLIRSVGPHMLISSSDVRSDVAAVDAKLRSMRAHYQHSGVTLFCVTILGAATWLAGLTSRVQRRTSHVVAPRNVFELLHEANLAKSPAKPGATGEILFRDVVERERLELLTSITQPSAVCYLHISPPLPLLPQPQLHLTVRSLLLLRPLLHHGSHATFDFTC